ncbi:MAG: hypothetical protein BWK75_02585 [Candidatus Altiarchaeales archaeon A3]|nr:MAG: hypothetical protein BWK75_02585 [Candidatus Altiarchaeales archaeon A3]
MLILSGCVEQKKDVSLTMNEMLSPINISPTFLYAKFNESVNGSVCFYMGDKFIGDANSNGGVVFMEYYGNLTAGEYKVKAVFSGNAQFNNASASGMLKIFKRNIVLDIGFEPDERIYFKDSLNVKAQLKVEGEEEGECANKEILLYVDDKFFGKNLTNDECFVEFTLKNLSTGELNVMGEYKGNEIYEDANATKNIEVISRMPVEIFADSKEVEPKDKNVTISASMKDYKERGINYGLKVTYNGNVIASLTSENKTFVLNISNWTLGTHHLQIIFDGTEIYENKSKDIVVQIINKYNLSGVEIKAEIPLEQIVNKKISVYTDGSNVSDYCAYEFESIADQEKGYRIYINEGNKDSMFLGKNKGIITVKHGYEMLPCHVFLCMNKNINCSIPEVIEAIGELENLSIAIDKDVSGKPLVVYDEIRGTLGYIQAYFVKNGRQIYIKPYLINGSKCELSPTRTAYQNLTVKEVNDCNFKGIFIKNADKRFMGVKDGKILLEGDETGLFVEETILEWLIAPEYAYNLRIKKQNK